VAEWPDTCAVIYGPVVLAGLFGNSGLDQAKVYGHYGPYEDKPVSIPDLVVSDFPENQIRRTDQTKLHFKAPVSKGDSVELVPFYQLFDQRYTIYWRKVQH
jgi:hypothetical protein